MGQLEQMQLKSYQDRKVFEEAKANVNPEGEDVQGMLESIEVLKKDNRRLKGLVQVHKDRRMLKRKLGAAAEAAPSEYFSCPENSPVKKLWSLKKEKVTFELSDDEPAPERVTKHSDKKMIDMNEDKPVVSATEHDDTDSSECDTQAFGVALNVNAPTRADTSQFVYRATVYPAPELERLCAIERETHFVEG